MLHAINHRKTEHCRGYLGHRAESAKRFNAEDEITSIVFGPLDFMEDRQVCRFWQAVFTQIGKGCVIGDLVSARSSVRLWPRRPIPGNIGKPKEPDAHIAFSSKDGARVDILIEVKWRQRLVRKKVEFQLRQQWQEYLEDGTRTDCWHFFIAPNIGDTISGQCLQGQDIWPAGRLIAFTWMDLRNVLTGLAGDYDGLARWAAATDCFLEKIGVCHFRGFAHLSAATPETGIVHQRFYGGLNHGFHGFTRAAESLPVLGCSFHSFFEE
ncbi:hypothetical protein [uncultured Thiodictyon sp.]|uniref:hypothetical protein n=1 Tax=uncultured Thiodictyon sp. TaxID=1846217 RepID=UPI0025D766DF|nr:hypothetical protein [uncultured Thiodictyon sp.]